MFDPSHSSDLQIESVSQGDAVLKSVSLSEDNTGLMSVSLSEESLKQNHFLWYLREYAAHPMQLAIAI